MSFKPRHLTIAKFKELSSENLKQQQQTFDNDEIRKLKSQWQQIWIDTFLYVTCRDEYSPCKPDQFRQTCCDIPQCRKCGRWKYILMPKPGKAPVLLVQSIADLDRLNWTDWTEWDKQIAWMESGFWNLWKDPLNGPELKATGYYPKKCNAKKDKNGDDIQGSGVWVIIRKKPVEYGYLTRKRIE